MSVGIYVHIPMCIRKCPYCDFYSVKHNEKLAKDFTASVIREITSCEYSGVKVDTVYFGGGTPTVLSSKQLVSILDAVKVSFDVCEDAEITIEANPSSVDAVKLNELRNNGFNRISFGVQSANDNELSCLGRLHDFGNAEKAVYDASKAGFDNISCDLMIGTPKQTSESLSKSIDLLSMLPITHISAYLLKIEQGTAYDCDKIKELCADDELMATLYLEAVNKLSRHGFKQYEISNFSKGAKRSRHNMKYWTLDDYLGFGPSAHSFYNGVRFYNVSDIVGYIKGNNIRCVEDLAPNELEEYTMLSLRLSDGLDFSKYESLGGDKERLMMFADELLEQGLAEKTGDSIWLTPRGFLVSNIIINKILQ